MQFAFNYSRPVFCRLMMCAWMLSDLSATGWAFGFYDGTGLAGGARWDAATRRIGGEERSLAGGLRFSLEGGSYDAFRRLLAWEGVAPTAEAFQEAVEDAFGFWETTDPVSGLGTTLRFETDLATTATAEEVAFGNGAVVRLGAEIDLLAAADGDTWNLNETALRSEAAVNWIAPGAAGIALASGTAGYAGFAISGADITFNNNPQALYTLARFRGLLVHEIGHALGLRDVDVDAGPRGEFVDDNYAPALALETLTNSFALLIDPLNPAASPLSLYGVANGHPGLDTPGVHILMESALPPTASSASPLGADDYAGRQFLYPVIPEPGAALLLAAWAGGWFARARRRSAGMVLARPRE